MEGSAEALLAEIDRIVTAEGVSAKEVSDAAVALAYLQAKGNRRCVPRSPCMQHNRGGGRRAEGAGGRAGR